MQAVVWPSEPGSAGAARGPVVLAGSWQGGYGPACNWLWARETLSPLRGSVSLAYMGALDGGEVLCDTHVLLRVPHLRIEVVDLDIVAGGIFGGKHAASSHIAHLSQDLNRL